MILRVLCLFLFSELGILQFSDAVPTRYDQRQDGKTNIDAKLENFLLLIAIPSDLNLLNSLPSIDLVSLKNEAKSSEVSLSTETPVVYETEAESHGRAPYHVDIIHIEKDQTGVKNADEESKTEKQAKSFWRREGRKIEGLEKEKEKMSNEMEVFDEFKDSYEKNGFKRKKSGTILKEILIKKGSQEISSLPSERNVEDEIGDKPQELKLLGGGIENCGPGRYRDKAGICQIDKNFN